LEVEPSEYDEYKNEKTLTSEVVVALLKQGAVNYEITQLITEYPDMKIIDENSIETEKDFEKFVNQQEEYENKTKEHISKKIQGNLTIFDSKDVYDVTDDVVGLANFAYAYGLRDLGSIISYMYQLGHLNNYKYFFHEIKNE
jgi:hypothetical protein